ncbi:hypothetical protein BDR26DRAFT_868139 [Obelidium mucronatum]|nr:hypothetical protein BDR26DRAFT_868139 [Obelidium mucronatum]
MMHLIPQFILIALTASFSVLGGTFRCGTSWTDANSRCGSSCEAPGFACPGISTFCYDNLDQNVCIAPPVAEVHSSQLKPLVLNSMPPCLIQCISTLTISSNSSTPSPEVALAFCKTELSSGLDPTTLAICLNNACSISEMTEAVGYLTINDSQIKTSCNLLLASPSSTRISSSLMASPSLVTSVTANPSVPTTSSINISTGNIPNNSAIPADENNRPLILGITLSLLILAFIGSLIWCCQEKSR